MIPNPYRGLRGLPADVWIVAATSLINRAGVMALPFLVLYVTKELGVSPSLAGLSVGVYGLGGFIVAPMAGRLADRVGPFAVLRGSLALGGVMLFILPLVHSFALLLVLVFIWAFVAEGSRPATMSALTGSAAPEQRKAAIALNRLAINLGMSIGPAVGGFLALLSFRLLFVVDGATCLAAAGVLHTLLWLQARRGHKTGEFIVSGSGRGAAGFAKRAAVWRDKRALGFFATAFLVNVVFSQYTGAMALHLVEDLGFRESFYGSLFVLNTLIIVVAEVPLNLAMAHWSTARANALGILLISIGFGSLGFLHVPSSIFGSVIIWTFGEMIYFPTATAHVADIAPDGRTGEYMGAFSATFSLAVIVGPWAGTTLLSHYGAGLTFGLMFALGSLSAILVLLSRARNTAPAALYS